MGATPQTAAEIEVATDNADFTVTSAVWNEALTAGGTFEAGQAYTLTVVLTAKGSNEFKEGAFTPTVANAASVGTTTTSAPGVGNTVSFTVTYAATDAITLTSIAVTTQPMLVYTEFFYTSWNGMVVTETYSDGSVSNVTFTNGTAEGYTTNPANGTTLTSSDSGKVVTFKHNTSGLTATTGALTVLPFMMPPLNPF
jgi:hypothetical protein